MTSLIYICTYEKPTNRVAPLRRLQTCFLHLIYFYITSLISSTSTDSHLETQLYVFLLLKQISH